jgi:hypothetical protein
MVCEVEVCAQDRRCVGTSVELVGGAQVWLEGGPRAAWTAEPPRQSQAGIAEAQTCYGCRINLSGVAIAGEGGSEGPGWVWVGEGEGAE